MWESYKSFVRLKDKSDLYLDKNCVSYSKKDISVKLWMMIGYHGNIIYKIIDEYNSESYSKILNEFVLNDKDLIK